MSKIIRAKLEDFEFRKWNIEGRKIKPFDWGFNLLMLAVTIWRYFLVDDGQRNNGENFSYFPEESAHVEANYLVKWSDKEDNYKWMELMKSI